jgi:MFS superfamily sulfate permease-like transporter
MAQGAGNFFSGLLGGIPLTSVIVRSSIGINSGAKSKAATMFHGVWLLIGFLFLTDIINLIPYASLAGILILSGYKLARLEIFTGMYRMGWSQFIPFMFTVTAIIFTDLLTGVLLGALVSIFFLLKTSMQIPFLTMDGKKSTGDILTLTLPSQVSFLNKARLKRILRAIPKGEKLSIDASEVQYMDADVREIFRDFISNPEIRKGVLVNYHASQESDGLPTFAEFTEVLDKESQKSLQPLQVLNLLKVLLRLFI